MKDMKPVHDAVTVIRVISSCKTSEQLEVARCMLCNYARMYGDKNGIGRALQTMSDFLERKRGRIHEVENLRTVCN